MLKKIISLFLVAISFLFVFPVSLIKAEELYLYSSNVVLMESSTKTVLYELEKDTQVAIASITKVMTLLLTMEAIEDGKLALDDTLYASAYAASMGGSDIWLEEGEAMSVNDLIKATVIMSANDAAVVLAEAVAGTVEAFVELMNERAKELGMENTVFKNCNGLDEDGHLSTAYDVALMSTELISHTIICDYTLTWMDYIRDGKTQLVNTNKMIKTYSGITGLKTGTTTEAGSCITATATRDGMSLIAVVLNAPSSDCRFDDATTLLNYGFAKWCISTPEVEIPENVSLLKAMQENIGVELNNDSTVLVEKTLASELECLVVFRSDLTAPVAINEVVGTVKIMSGDDCLKEISLVATENVEEITFLRVAKLFLSKMSL